MRLLLLLSAILTALTGVGGSSRATAQPVHATASVSGQNKSSAQARQAAFAPLGQASPSRGVALAVPPVRRFALAWLALYADRLRE